MGLFETLFGKKKPKITLEDADKINDEFIAKNPVAASGEDELMRQASKLMTSKNYAESIEVYKKLAANYPEKKGLYESQIGVGHYFMENYAEAIKYYVQAMNNGQDREMMDDNIWEATEGLYEQTGDKSVIENYLNMFPDGEYKKEASKLL